MAISTEQRKDTYFDLQLNTVRFLFNRSLLLSIIFLFVTNYTYAFEVKSGEWTEQTIGESHGISKKDGETILKSSYSIPPNLVCYTPDWIDRIKNLKKGLVERADGCTHTWTESSNTKLVRESICQSQGLKAYIVTDSTKISDTHYISTMNSNEETPTTKTATKQKTISNFVSSTCSTDSVTYLIKK